MLRTRIEKSLHAATWRLSVFGLVAVAAMGLMIQAATAEPMVIKFSHVNTDNTPKGYAANKFKELAEKYLEGKVKVEVYPNSTLYGDAQEMEALLLNDVQIIAPSLSKFGRYTEKLQIFDLPFLFDAPDDVTRFQESQTGQDLLRSIEDRGFTGLGYIHNGMKQFSANKEVHMPEDASGLRVRIQPSHVIEAQYEAIGANPQKMAFSEVYQALQTGVVDAQENSWTSIYTMKFYEVQPYIVETNHGMMSFMATVSTAWWKGLPDDIREGLDKAIKDAAADANAFADDMHKNNRKRILESGRSEIIELTPDQLKAWRAAMRPVYDRFKDDIGADLIDAAQAANSQ
jgi:C4-dicarboxylate-binding protein DctP